MTKKNYVVFYRKLKFYYDHGIRLSSVYRVLPFSQTR